MGSCSLLLGIFPTRDRTQVSRNAGRFFTSWTTREAQEYWGGQPVPSPTDLPEPGSPALQADSLSTELPGKTTVLRSRTHMTFILFEGQLNTVDFSSNLWNKQHWKNFYITLLSYYVMLLFYGYLLNIVKVLSLQRKNIGSVMGHDSWNCITPRGQAGWQNKRRKCYERANLYLSDEEVILAWLRGQWVHQARLTIGWQFHWPFPSKAFLFQTSGPSLILQAKELNLYSLSPSLHGYLLVWALLHWEMSPFSQNQNRGTLEGTASCLPKPSLLWLKTESHLVPGHISAHPTLQLDVCIRSLDRRHGNGSFAFDFQKAVL